MSEHKDMQEQLSAYLDGELSGEDARRVKTALANDASLAYELERLRKTRDLLRSLPRERAGENFTEKVMQAAAQQGALPGAGTWRPPGIPNPWRRYLAAAALIVFAVGLGIFFAASIYEPGPEPTPPSELAIKPLTGAEDMDSRGTIARDLSDFRSETMKKTEVRPTESLAFTEKDKLDTTEHKRLRDETVSPPEMTGKMDLASPSAEAPAERPLAKGAPTRRRPKPVAGKGGRIEEEEYSFARKVDRKGKSGVRHVSRKGPSAPYDRPTAYLAGPQSTDKLVKLIPPADNEIIYTDDLTAGQKQVEAVFASNAVEITPSTRRVLQPSQANLYQTLPKKQKADEKPVPPQQLQYVVYGTPSQLKRVRAQLDRDVRARQTVAQRPMLQMERNGQAQSAPVTGERIPQADLKEQKQVSREIPRSRTATTPAANQKVYAGVPVRQQAATRPATRGIAQSPQQVQPVLRESRRQERVRARLLSNQAMLITLKVRQAAKK